MLHVNQKSSPPDPNIFRLVTPSIIRINWKNVSGNIAAKSYCNYLHCWMKGNPLWQAKAVEMLHRKLLESIT